MVSRPTSATPKPASNSSTTYLQPDFAPPRVRVAYPRLAHPRLGVYRRAIDSNDESETPAALWRTWGNAALKRGTAPSLRVVSFGRVRTFSHLTLGYYSTVAQGQVGRARRAGQRGRREIRKSAQGRPRRWVSPLRSPPLSALFWH